MSATHDVDRLLATWFAADATETAPAGLVETIAQVTATTRRRPGWLLVAHRMPALPQLPIAIRLVALAAILLAVAIASIVVVGSRPRVPPPFGPARPGIFALSVLGDIVTMTTDGVPLRTWTSDDAWDSNPAFSRDGTQLAFWSWPLDSNFSRTRGDEARRVRTPDRCSGRVPLLPERLAGGLRMVARRPFHRVLGLGRQRVPGLHRQHGGSRSHTRRRSGAQGSLSRLVTGRLHDRDRGGGQRQ